MKVFSVVGYSKSGKTTTIEEIIKELRRRNYTVGSVKDIHFEGFHMDTEGTNTHRHKIAGSQLVTARGLSETDILFQEHLDIYKIAEFYDMDYLVLEGVREANVPMILTAETLEDLDERFDGRAFLVSGKISDTIKEYRGLPAISALEDIATLVDKIDKTVFPLLPDYDPNCCSQCGSSCRELCVKIISGEKKFSDCVVLSEDVQLKINGRIIKMVPFVQSILKNNVEALVKELDGYKKDGTIEIIIGQGYGKS